MIQHTFGNGVYTMLEYLRLDGMDKSDRYHQLQERDIFEDERLNENTLRKIACRVVREVKMPNGKTIEQIADSSCAQDAVSIAEQYAEGKVKKRERLDTFKEAEGDAGYAPYGVIQDCMMACANCASEEPFDVIDYIDGIANQLTKDFKAAWVAIESAILDICIDEVQKAANP